jgi:hypothetical protein
MTEHVEKYTNKAIEIIADYIQRTNKKNEQLQEAKVRLDKKSLCSQTMRTATQTG